MDRAGTLRKAFGDLTEVVDQLSDNLAIRRDDLGDRQRITDDRSSAVKQLVEMRTAFALKTAIKRG